MVERCGKKLPHLLNHMIGYSHIRSYSVIHTLTAHERQGQKTAEIMFFGTLCFAILNGKDLNESPKIVRTLGKTEQNGLAGGDKQDMRVQKRDCRF